MFCFTADTLHEICSKLAIFYDGYMGLEFRAYGLPLRRDEVG